MAPYKCPLCFSCSRAGPIPRELGGLERLQRLFLTGNKLSGKCHSRCVKLRFNLTLGGLKFGFILRSIKSFESK